MAAQARARYENADGAQRMHQTCATALKKHEADLRLHEEQLANAEKKVKAQAQQQDTDNLKVQLADAEGYDRRRRAYRLFAALRYPEAFWEGDRASLDAEMVRLQTSIEANTADAAKADKSIGEVQSQVRVLRSKLVTSLVCPTCKQEVKNKEELAAQNARIELEIAQAEARLPDLQRTLGGCQATAGALRAELQELQALTRCSAAFEQFATANGQHLEVDFGFVPPRLKWAGDVPEEASLDPQELKNRIAALEKSQDEGRRAAGQAETLRAAILDDRAAIDQATANLRQYPAVVDIDDLHREWKACCATVENLKAGLDVHRDNIARLKARMDSAQREYDQAVQWGDHLRAEVKRIQADLDRLAFNNALLKKVRAIRPLVADKLWNQVLAAVSTMFTQVRGDRSVVTKSADGFLVNGTSTRGLSGSTLDALGMAIRIALVKTFLPHCSMLVLDEPCAAADEARTTSMLGFVASAGFDQTLLVTHESTSEAFADNLITL